MLYIFIKTDKRGSWSPHTVDGWYLGTSPDHYQSHIIYVKGTKADRIPETVFFKHKYLPNPTFTHTDKAVNEQEHYAKL